MYSIEESICDIFETFRPPLHSFGPEYRIKQWRALAIFVGCSPGSQPAKNCEGSPAVLVVTYHKPFEHLNRLAVDHDKHEPRPVLPNQWVAKLFQVGREAFLNVTVFY